MGIIKTSETLRTGGRGMTHTVSEIQVFFKIGFDQIVFLRMLN